MASGKWYYSKEKLENSPSRKDGIEAVRELRYRQEAADLIHFIGEQLNLTNAIISSAVVYMHRFYVYHSFVQFHRYPVSAASIFLAAKSESMPKRLECVVRALHACIYRSKGRVVDTASKDFKLEAENILCIEHIMIQTLGFELDIEHPHAYVLKFCQEIKASKDFAQACYFLATECLEATTMCLRYSPKVIARFCIYFATKLTNWEIFENNQDRTWFCPGTDSDVSLDLLVQLAQEFEVIFDRSATRWRQKVMSIVQGRNSPQLTSTATESTTRSSLVLADGRSQHQYAGSVAVSGQVTMIPQANPSLLGNDIGSNTAKHLERPFQKCFLTSLPSTSKSVETTKSKDSLRSTPSTSVSIFNPDVPNTEVQTILSRLVPSQNQSTLDRNGSLPDLMKVQKRELSKNSFDLKPSMIGESANHHSRPPIVLKIPRNKINESLDRKISEINRPPLRLTIKIPSLKTSKDCNDKNLTKSVNKDSVSPPAKKFKH